MTTSSVKASVRTSVLHHSTSLKVFCGGCGGRMLSGFSEPVQLWPHPGPAVGGGGPVPPVNKLWKTRFRVPLSKPATSGIISSSAFCAGDSRWRTSNCGTRAGGTWSLKIINRNNPQSEVDCVRGRFLEMSHLFKFKFKFFYFSHGANGLRRFRHLVRVRKTQTLAKNTFILSPQKHLEMV